MHKTIIGLGLMAAFTLSGSNAYALSCLPIDMYLDTVVGDNTTIIFSGTATQVKDHTQVVTVDNALQGWVAPQVWVNHPWSSDWQYFCSNGPAKAGEETVFLVTLDEHGQYAVTQTLDVDAKEAKELIAALKDAKVDAGITEATPKERAEAVRESIMDLMKTLLSLFAEFKYWNSNAK